MANKSEKNNKKIIAGICAAVVVVAIVVVAIVMVTKNGGGLNDSYFVSDDTKYVLTLEGDQVSFDDSEHAPLKSHLVYTYSDDKITGLKAYCEYADNETAKAAYDYMSSNQEGEDYKNIELNGKFVILEANESEYEGLTASDVKQQIEYLEMLKSMDLNNGDTVDEDSVEETENTEE